MEFSMNLESIYDDKKMKEKLCMEIKKEENHKEKEIKNKNINEKEIIKKKCSFCNKKLKIISYDCRCGGRFCDKHRLTHSHKCKGIEEKMAKIIEPIFIINYKNDETYDWKKKDDMVRLVKKVRTGYRIYKIAKLLIFLI